MTIRRQPEDFIVEEMLTSAASAIVRQDQGPFALYELHKKSTNTPDAISDLARELRINPSDLAFVGLKDKHAVTSQYVTARLLKAPVTVGKGNWEARRIGWLNHQLDADMVAGNRFKLVVRDLAPARASQMDGYARQLMPADKRTLFIVNYFGDQRFGSARHQQGFAAPLLLRGDYLGALKLLIATPSRTDKQSLREFRRTLAQGWGDFVKVLPRLPRCADRRAVEVLAKNPGEGDGGICCTSLFHAANVCVFLSIVFMESHGPPAIGRTLP
ncbi:MAG: tRNA pseudouridine(13) synthase TruD [Phycisphaerales bacterium]|nr:tRNA pseudouridine(13) synthase TruD [Phycisphaerales bacterium]